MAVDRLADDHPEEISGSIREKQHENTRQPADGMAAEKEATETRSRAEYYRALMGVLNQHPRNLRYRLASKALDKIPPAHAAAVITAINGHPPGGQPPTGESRAA